MQFSTHLKQRTTNWRLLTLFLAALILFGLAGGRYLLEASGFSASSAGQGQTRDLAYWQELAGDRPNDIKTQTLLGLAYLEAARVTGEGANYSLAEGAFDSALALDDQFQAGNGYSADSLDALIGQGILALARHDFQSALEIGQEARALNPFRAQVLGILVDAHVELGRYDEAVALAQEMVDLRPGLPSYSRIAYLRELHGDSAGAIEAMETAVSSGIPGSEQLAWTQVQLGHLHFKRGDLENAEAVYREALHHRPDYPFALEGIGRIQALRGESAAALNIVNGLMKEQPTADRAILLGSIYLALGDQGNAEEQYNLARHLLDHHNADHGHGVGHSQQSAQNIGSGMNVDKEMALFEADYGYPRRALRLARAAYEAQPNIYAADTLAWALYKNGQFEEAQQFSQEALRLETADASLYLHAAQIAEALGDDAAAAEYEAAAMAINPLGRLPGS